MPLTTANCRAMRTSSHAGAPPPPPPAPSIQPVLPMPGAPPFLFVVDASNVALRHGNKETFSCRGVEICLDYLGRRFPGARVALFLPDYLLDAKKVAAKKKLGGRPAETPDDVMYLQGLQRRGVLFGTPSQDYDDAYQIEYARNHDGVIISNDLFRDAVDKQPFMQRAAFRRWLQEHVLSFTFIGDEFCPNPEFQLPFLARGPVSILQ